MEALLSVSFDYLSSYDASKIRKGLRQVEGLLAQICLSRSKNSAAEKRRSVVSPGSVKASAKELGVLKEDLAFKEFFKLQEGFEYNVAIRLISCLERLLGKGSNGQNDLLILSTLDLIQGILLLHPPSRSLFAREIYMNLLLDLLEPTSCPAIQSSTLLTLVAALLSSPPNTRTFETLDGLLTVTSLFKQRSTSREVKLRVVEFLYFYLMPEEPPASTSKLVGVFDNSGSGQSTAGGGGGGGGGAGRNGKDTMGASTTTKTTSDKQTLLGRYLNNVEDLVADLRESAPFGGAMAC